jgi:hypothetical protein
MSSRTASRAIYLVALLVGTSRTAAADPFQIQVLNNTSSTSLTATRQLSECGPSGGCVLGDMISTNQELSSSNALSSQMLSPSPDLTPGLPAEFVWAQAAASQFDVSVFTTTPTGVTPTNAYEFSTAGARSVVDFAPTSTGMASLQLNFTGGLEWFFSEGAVSLTDQTTGIQQWAFGWDGCCNGSVPFETSGVNRGLALIGLNQLFNVNDVYELSIYTRTFANFDSERMNVNVSGLQAIPEPGALVLCGMALIGIAVMRRRAIQV